MATITNANLAITVNSQAGTANCVVTARVYFTTYEMNEIKEGLAFALHCALMGEDLGILNPQDPDDLLYRYPSKYFPDSTPTSPENVRFEASLGTSRLDEDSGTDKVYGLLILKNLYTDRIIIAKTNVVIREFGG